MLGAAWRAYRTRRNAVATAFDTTRNQPKERRQSPAQKHKEHPGLRRKERLPVVWPSAKPQKPDWLHQHRDAQEDAVQRDAANEQPFDPADAHG